MKERNPLPPIIYKYSKLDEYFFQLLIKNEFWFSEPKAFNDPYDCNICFAEKAPESEQEIKENYFLPSDFDRDIFKGKSEQEIGEIFESKARTEAYKENDYLKQIKQQAHNAGICCFSATHNNLLMWSHYADSHRGVCIGYSSNELLQSFGEINWVKYGNKFPEIKSLESFPKREVMTTKSEDWAYEKELRIIASPQAHPFKRDAVKELIFGLNTPASQIRAIMALIFQLDYKYVDIKQVIIADNEYKIKFKHLAPSEK